MAKLTELVNQGHKRVLAITQPDILGEGAGLGGSTRRSDVTVCTSPVRQFEFLDSSNNGFAENSISELPIRELMTIRAFERY